ncbi:MAG: alpha/beta hydrolase [Planctomycetota bacterium]
MLLILIPAAVLLVAGLLLALLIWLGLWAARGRPGGAYWRRVGWAHVALVPLHLFVSVPAAFGYLGSRMLQTRGDEAAYAGPQLRDDGAWVPQSRASLKAMREGDNGELPPGVTAVPPVFFEAGDGVRLRAFLVPAIGAPTFSAVLVHGMFRGALELEPVAAMLRELGGDVLLLELRNHGASDRRPATFGLRESLDVLAAVRWLRARPDQAGQPLLLFGVSLGTAAVSLAAPQVDDLAGVVLDAPIVDVLETAHRIFTVGSRGPNRRGLALPQPWRSLVFTSIEWWSNFSMREVRPGAALAKLAPNVPVLLVGGGDDRRVPPDTIAQLFDSLPTTPSRKSMWIEPAAGHGSVWSVAPAKYRQHLTAITQQFQ